MSDDSIPEAALQVTFSVIDEITSEIFLNPADRLDKFEALQVCFLCDHVNFRKMGYSAVCQSS